MLRWIGRIVFVIIILVILAVIVLFATGNSHLLRLGAGFLFGAPSGTFDPANAVSAPDYSDNVNWAALPTTLDRADRVPAGFTPRPQATIAPVDVFFIHPTGFITGDSWTWTMDLNSKTEENTQWMLTNQASAYNGCCNVYAPRYRQANIFAYFQSDQERDRILDFVYQDVEAAFDYYISNFNNGRPFIIASHSQGTHHGSVLLRDRIDGTPLAQRMVAAYLIGGALETSDFTAMADFNICTTPDQVHCVIHWATYSDQANRTASRAGHLCVNPLDWQHGAGAAPRADHAGALPASGTFQLDFWDDSPTGMAFPGFGAPLPNHLSARCEDTGLYVDHQTDRRFETGLGVPNATNYHMLDYPLFYMDIRENAVLRAQRYLQP